MLSLPLQLCTYKPLVEQEYIWQTASQGVCHSFSSDKPPFQSAATIVLLLSSEYISPVTVSMTWVANWRISLRCSVEPQPPLKGQQTQMQSQVTCTHTKRTSHRSWGQQTQAQSQPTCNHTEAGASSEGAGAAEAWPLSTACHSLTGFKGEVPHHLLAESGKRKCWAC